MKIRSNGSVGVLTVCALASIAGPVGGQTCQTGFTAGFPNTDGLNNEVRSVAIYDSGSGPQLYAAGPFTAAGTTPHWGVARWTGSAWGGVGNGLGGGYAGVPQAYVLAALTLGSQHALYIGGRFEDPGRNIARWNGQGWSSLGVGLNDIVRAITVYDGGSGPALYAAGHFYMSVASQETRGIARWDGGSWQPLGSGLTLAGATWQPNVGHGYAMAVLDLGDGPKLYVAGRFTSAGGVPASNIARWDGQQWSAIGATGSGVYGVNSQIMKLGLFDHGFGPQMTIGGRFSLTPAGAVRPRVARWTGSAWVQVGSDLSGDPAHTVNSFVSVPGPAGPSLHVGGIFTGAGWLSQVNYAARLGSPDWVGMEGGMSDYIWSLAAHTTGTATSLYAGGKFGFAGGTVAKRVARWDGSEWHGFETQKGLTGPAYAACVYDDGSGEKIYVGGDFFGAGDHVCNGIAAWNGEAWEGVGSGVQQQSGSSGQVTSLAVFDSGSGPALYAGGLFSVAGGGPCFNIARWDGAFWSSPGGNGPNDAARALAVFDDGGGPALYVGGAFGASAGIPTPGIVRFDGTGWSGVGPASLGVTVNALAVFDDGEGPALYAGGQFLQLGGAATPSIARWNGSTWTSFGGVTISLASTFPGVVNALTVHDDGSGPALYAGGKFGAAGGVGVHGNVARFRDSVWSAVGSVASVAPTAPVQTLASAHHGSGEVLYVGGQFISTYGGQTATSLVRWDGASWSPVGQGVSAPAPLPGPGLVKALIAHGPSLFIAGSFGAAGGVRSDHVAEWRSCSCYADCNGSGAMTVADFGCFQTKFVAADPWADCNADSALSIADFGCFQTKFVAGCP